MVACGPRRRKEMTTDKAPWYDRGSLTLNGLFYITLTVTWRDGEEGFDPIYG